MNVCLTVAGCSELATAAMQPTHLLFTHLPDMAACQSSGNCVRNTCARNMTVVPRTKSLRSACTRNHGSCGQLASQPASQADKQTKWFIFSQSTRLPHCILHAVHSANSIHTHRDSCNQAVTASKCQCLAECQIFQTSTCADKSNV